MGLIKAFSRLSHHTLTTPGLTFSVPLQEDFTIQGTTMSWTSTDLCLSEIGVNEADQKVFIRIGGTVSQLINSNTGPIDFADTLSINNITGGNDIQMTLGDSINGGTTQSSSINLDNGVQILPYNLNVQYNDAALGEYSISNSISGLGLTTSGTGTRILTTNIDVPTSTSQMVVVEADVIGYSTSGVSESRSVKLIGTFRFVGGVIISIGGTIAIYDVKETGAVFNPPDIGTNGSNSIFIQADGKSATNMIWTAYYTQKLIGF